MKRFTHALAAAIIGTCSVSIAAQPYPARPVRILTGFPIGGATDIMARILGQKVSEHVGQQIVVDNRPSAAGILAGVITKNAPGDGYTLLMVTSSHATSAAFGKLPYDAVRDFAAVALLATGPNVLVATGSLPARNVEEIVKLARAKPGQVNFGSGGNGSITHLSGELLKQLAGIDLAHIPYKGAPLAFTDLIAGQIQLLFSSIPGALPHVRAGRIKGIAVTTLKERAAVLPDLPTIAESGVPGFEAANWFGLLAPAATPPALIARLNSEFLRALANPDAASAIVTQGVRPKSSTPAEFQALVRTEVAKWSKVVQSAGIKAE